MAANDDGVVLFRGRLVEMGGSEVGSAEATVRVFRSPLPPLASADPTVTVPVSKHAVKGVAPLLFSDVEIVIRPVSG